MQTQELTFNKIEYKTLPLYIAYGQLIENDEDIIKKTVIADIKSLFDLYPNLKQAYGKFFDKYERALTIAFKGYNFDELFTLVIDEKFFHENPYLREKYSKEVAPYEQELAKEAKGYNFHEIFTLLNVESLFKTSGTFLKKWGPVVEKYKNALTSSLQEYRFKELYELLEDPEFIKALNEFPPFIRGIAYVFIHHFCNRSFLKNSDHEISDEEYRKGYKDYLVEDLLYNLVNKNGTAALAIICNFLKHKDIIDDEGTLNVNTIPRYRTVFHFSLYICDLLQHTKDFLSYNEIKKVVKLNDEQILYCVREKIPKLNYNLYHFATLSTSKIHAKLKNCTDVINDEVINNILNITTKNNIEMPISLNEIRERFKNCVGKNGLFNMELFYKNVLFVAYNANDEKGLSNITFLTFEDKLFDFTFVLLAMYEQIRPDLYAFIYAKYKAQNKEDALFYSINDPVYFTRIKNNVLNVMQIALICNNYKLFVDCASMYASNFNARIEGYDDGLLHLTCALEHANALVLMLNFGIKEVASKMARDLSIKTQTVIPPFKKALNIRMLNKQEAAPLHIACYTGNFEIVDLLCDALDIEANRNNKYVYLYYTDENGYAPIHYAIACKDEAKSIQVVKYLLAKDKSQIFLTTLNEDRFTLLHLACYFGKSKLLNYLLTEKKVTIQKNAKGLWPWEVIKDKNVKATISEAFEKSKKDSEEIKENSQSFRKEEDIKIEIKPPIFDLINNVKSQLKI
ncbi:MAG: ankyrin repeat domain-containing protein [Sphingobacteriia bacterium]|nr:ankyrin repeat domain-containing protein [Sphingobacteriia bacterium]